MGVNDTLEQLRVAQAYAVELEATVESLTVERDEARKVIAGGPRVTAENYRALLGCRARIDVLEVERDSLSALHEVATERTVQVAAVIEQAKRRILDAELDGTGRQDDTWNNALRFASDVLERVDPEAELREVRATAWDEGHRVPRRHGPDECSCGAWNEGECACGLYGAGHLLSLADNPYREEADRG